MMPHALSSASAGSTGVVRTERPPDFLSCLRAISLETIEDDLIDAAWDALVKRLPASLRAQAEASDDFDELIGSHAKRLARAVLRGPKAVSPADQIKADFHEFRNHYKPSRFGDPAQVWSLFAALPWDDAALDEDGLTFRQAFLEGFDRCVLSADWAKEDGKYVPGAVKFLTGERWRETGQKTIKGALAKGTRQLQREAAERKAKPPIVAQMAAALKMESAPTNARPADKRTNLDLARESLIEAMANGDAERIEKYRATFRMAGGGMIELQMIEKEFAQRAKESA